MTVETATYINQLDSSKPASGDARSEGDDHMRLLKSTLQATFPNISGAVTATQGQLNGVLLGQATYVAGGGAADAYTASINTTQITSYSDGLTLLVKSPATNTGASTINVNSLGVKTIVRNDGTTLSAGDLVSGSVFQITYNSTTGKFHLASALASSGAYVQKAGDTMTGALTVSGPFKITGTAIGAGGERWIGADGSTSGQFYNAPTGGAHYFGINNSTKLSVTGSGVKVTDALKTNTIEPASGGTVTITGAALTTPALGTPASGTLTNCTGLPASAVVNTPADGISATTVQAAINELGTEKANLSGASFTGVISANHDTADTTCANFSNTSAAGYGLYSRGGGGANYGALFVNYSTANTLAVLSGAGDWTVAGTASFAATNCRIASNGNVTNLNGVYGTISERRFKNVLGLTTPKLQKILQLSALVCNYTLKDDPEQIKQIGLIVDEVEAISPGLIFTEPVLESVSVTRTIQRQRTETKTVQRQAITVQNGRAVMTSESVSVNAPVFGSVPVFDEHGQPVLDGNGQQLMHSFPVMEDVQETYTEMRDLGQVRKGIKWSVVVPMLLRAFGDLHSDFDARIKLLETA